MTAEGKITAASLVTGSRIMVTFHGENLAPSTTKKKNAHPATVLTITRYPVGTNYMAPAYGGEMVRRIRRRSDFDILVQVQGRPEAYTLRNVTPSQTFWLA